MNFINAFSEYNHAYNGTSFSPEKRIASDRASFEADYRATESSLLKLAKSEAQKQVLLEQMARYFAGYKKHYGAYLAAHSRCMSSMITGPANFPVRRNQKNNRITDDRLKDFMSWHDRATAAMRRNILAARTPEEIAAEEWQHLKKRTLESITTIHQLDTGELAGYDRALFVSNLANRIKTLAQNGKGDLVKKALTLIRIQQSDFKKAIFTPRHSIWKQEEAAKLTEIALDAKANREDEILARFEGVELVAAYGAERLRFMFEDKPDEETRAALKGSAWKWSPRAEAWQRKDTANARYNAKRIAEKCHFKPLQAAA